MPSNFLRKTDVHFSTLHTQLNYRLNVRVEWRHFRYPRCTPPREALWRHDQPKQESKPRKSEKSKKHGCQPRRKSPERQFPKSRGSGWETSGWCSVLHADSGRRTCEWVRSSAWRCFSNWNWMTGIFQHLQRRCKQSPGIKLVVSPQKNNQTRRRLLTREKQKAVQVRETNDNAKQGASLNNTHNHIYIKY